MLSERLTDRARQVIQLAGQEAERFNREYIGTEHIFLALIVEPAGVAANALKNLAIDVGKIRTQVEMMEPPGPERPISGRLPQTPRAKKAVELALEEARNLKQCTIGPEHLFLGVLREQEGVAAQALVSLGVPLKSVRDEVLKLLGVTPDLAEENRSLSTRMGGCDAATVSYLGRKKDERIVIGKPVAIEVKIIDFNEDFHTFEANYVQLEITAITKPSSANATRLQWGDQMCLSQSPLVEVLFDRFEGGGVRLAFSLPEHILIMRRELWEALGGERADSLWQSGSFRYPGDF
jgi:sRNA-binding carbon storage regulator CsrA